jgi:FMN phosphatase YigB (HAD superfamily)
MHWEHQASQRPMLGMFDLQFLSLELGLVKPGAAIFQIVADQLPVSRDRVLDLDDVALDSDAARSFGFVAEQVRGIEETRQLIMNVGMLTG